MKHSKFVLSILSMLLVALILPACAGGESEFEATKLAFEMTKLAFEMQEAGEMTPEPAPAETGAEEEAEAEPAPAQSDSPSAGPNQALAAELCPPGQELLYYEDFEDGNAWGWYNIEDTEHSYEQVAGRGTVLSMRISEGFAEVFYLDDFANAVWLVDVRAGEEPQVYSLTWHNQKDPKQHYFSNFAGGGYLQIHFRMPNVHEAQSGLVESAEPLPPREPGDWQQWAFSYFDGQVDLWLDDKFIAGETHADPIETGGFGFYIKPHPDPVSVDNVVVCSLDAPYAP